MDEISKKMPKGAANPIFLPPFMGSVIAGSMTNPAIALDVGGDMVRDEVRDDILGDGGYDEDTEDALRK